MRYWQELRVHSRALVAACLGLSSGWLILSYITNNFVPHLLAEFGWSHAEFSLIGVLVLLPALCLPIVGRLTDTYGVRRVAVVGIVATPVTFLLFATMTGDFSQFFIISALQAVLVGGTTTSLVYSRLIAERIVSARGLAVGLGACCPAAVAAATAPLLSDFIVTYGWRAGYVMVALCTAIAGLLTLFLIPKRGQGAQAATQADAPMSLRGYRQLAHDPVFLVITVGMFLCNLPYMVLGLQLKVILLERAMTAAAASWMISLFASGVVLGRLICGLALDRFTPHIVTAIALGLPAIGLLALASGLEQTLILAAAVSVLGLSLGAESDIIAFLVMRYFRVEVYSTIFGVVAAAAAISAALGALLLSILLELTGSFGPFLYLAAVSAATGSLLFLSLGRLTGPNARVTAMSNRKPLQARDDRSRTVAVGPSTGEKT